MEYFHLDFNHISLIMHVRQHNFEHIHAFMITNNILKWHWKKLRERKKDSQKNGKKRKKGLKKKMTFNAEKLRRQLRKERKRGNKKIQLCHSRDVNLDPFVPNDCCAKSMGKAEPYV